MSNFESIRAEMKTDLQEPLENLQQTLDKCDYLEATAQKTLADCETIITGDGTATNPGLEAKANTIGKRIQQLKEGRFNIDDFSTEEIADEESIAALQVQLENITAQIADVKEYFAYLKEELKKIVGHNGFPEKLFTSTELAVLDQETPGLDQKILSFDVSIVESEVADLKTTIEKKTPTVADLNNINEQGLVALQTFCVTRKQELETEQLNAKKKNKPSFDGPIRQIGEAYERISQELKNRQENFVEMPAPSQRYLDAEATKVTLQEKDKRYALFAEVFQEVVQNQRAEIAHIDATLIERKARQDEIPDLVSVIEENNRKLTNPNNTEKDILLSELETIPQQIIDLENSKKAIEQGTTVPSDLTNIVSTIDLGNNSARDDLTTLLEEFGYKCLIDSTFWLADSVAVRKVIPNDIQLQKTIMDEEQEKQDEALLEQLQQKQAAIRAQITAQASGTLENIKKEDETISGLEQAKQQMTDVAELQAQNKLLGEAKGHRQQLFEQNKTFLSEEQNWIVGLLQAERTTLLAEKINLEGDMQSLFDQIGLPSNTYTNLSDLPVVPVESENSLQTRIITQKQIKLQAESKYQELKQQVGTASGNKSIQITSTMAQLKGEIETAQQTLGLLQFEQGTKKQELAEIYTQWVEVNTNLPKLEMYILQHQLESDLIQKRETYRQKQVVYDEAHQQSEVYSDIYERNVEGVNAQEKTLVDAMSVLSACKLAYGSISAGITKAFDLSSLLLSLTKDSPVNILISRLSGLENKNNLSGSQLETVIVALGGRELLDLSTPVSEDISTGFIGEQRARLSDYYEIVGEKKQIKGQKSASEYDQTERTAYNAMLEAQQQQDAAEQRKKQVDEVVTGYGTKYIPLVLKTPPAEKK